MTKTISSDFQTSVTAATAENTDAQQTDKMIVEMPKLAKGMPQRMFSV